MHIKHLLPLAGMLMSAFSLPLTASAATPITGTLSTNTTWTKADSPYIVTGTFTVPFGIALTILPGTVVKLDHAWVDIFGTLKSGTATASERVYFTSINDDSVGGDTNNNGTSTSPSATDWKTLSLRPGAVGEFYFTSIFYSGGSDGGAGRSAIVNDHGTLTLDHVVMNHSELINLSLNSGIANINDSEITGAFAGIYSPNPGSVVTMHHSSIHGNWACAICNGSPNAIDATNNWWGSASGPYSTAHNASGTGDVIDDPYNSTTFTPWLTQAPDLNATATPATSTDPCAGVTDCFSNVLFLPGMMGSRLFEESSACGVFNNEKERWVSRRDCDHAHLALDIAGKSLYSLYSKEGVHGVVDDTYSFNIYQSFMDDLDTWKNNDHIIADYAIIPYDWRLSLEDVLQNGATSTDGTLSYSTPQRFTHSYIYQQLKRLADSSKTKRVTIIAHSNGGLVTKALIQKLRESHDPLYDKIDNVIFVTVPQIGTPEAIMELLHGKELGPLGFVMSAERLRNLSQNMTSAYHLLPSGAYFFGSGATVETPVIIIQDGTSTQSFVDTYGHEITSELSLRNFLLGADGRSAPIYDDLKNPNVLNPNLLTAAAGVHSQLDDNWQFSTSTTIYQIAGWGEDTVASIEYKTIPYCERTQSIVIQGRLNYYCVEMGSRMTFDPKEVVDGDGTVVVPSALAMSTSSPKVGRWWVDLLKYDEFLRGNIERKHADILEISELRIFIHNILTNTTDTYFEFISTTTPATEPLFRKSHLRFILHSPLHLSAIDNFGNTISSTTSTILGSRWKQYGEVQVLTVPKNIPITLNLDGYATGSFTLDIEEINGSNTIIASSTLAGIPSATSTKATIAFTDGTMQNASPLHVDYDGDGNNDFTLVSKIGKEVVFDTTPPEARISFSTSTKRLLIEGIDVGGATTILTSATSTLIIDEVGNTLEIIFGKFKQEKHELKPEIQELRYNGVSTGILPKTVLQYEWSTDEAENIKELKEKVTVGTLTIEGHYDARKNITRIKTKLSGQENEENRERKEILSGLVIVGITARNGNIEISY